MKNIILIGASRSGKSTLTKLLNEKLNTMIIRTDLLRLAFRDAIYKNNTIKTSTIKENPDYKSFVLNYYKYANMYEPDYIKVVDTVDFNPKDCNAFDNAIIICLGYPNITKEEAIANWKKYDTENDWTKNKNDEELLKHAEKEIKNSKILENECKKYNIKFIDTSSNRDKKLNELLDYIIKEIKV